nr:biotin/lipoyl-binding protein [uncultured Propionivibrio sp.]
MNSPTLAPASGDIKRKRQLLLLATGCLVAIAAYGAYWLLVARYKADTDNAYVQGNIVQITPQIGGTVVAVEADDTDMVKAGQRLIRLDPADARIALDQAEAQLAETVREVRSLFAANAALAAGVDSRKSDLARAQAELARLSDDLARRKPLVDGGAVSREEVLHLQTAVDNAKSSENAASANLAEAREQLAKNLSLTEKHHAGNASARPRRRRQGARRLARQPASRHRRADRRHGRQAQRPGRPARCRRHAADGRRSARPALG